MQETFHPSAPGAVAAPAPRKGRGKPSPVLLLSAGLAVAFTVVAVFEPDDLPIGATVEPPRLFAQAACAAGPGVDPEHRAAELEERAFAKYERSPFSAQDGLEAVLLLDEARACFVAGGNVARTAELTAYVERWRRRLELDYQHARLRLELALQQARAGSSGQWATPDEQTREIERSLRELRGLLSHQSGPYLDWLNQVARQYAPREER